MSEEKPRQTAASIPSMWVIGVLVSTLGGAIVSQSSDDAGKFIGFVIVAAGGLIVSVGVIASGVSLGMRHFEENRES